MSKTKRFNKEKLSESINAVLSMDDSDLVNNVVDILVGSDNEERYTAFRPSSIADKARRWTLLKHLTNMSVLARRIVDRLFPVPKAPLSFYADIW